MKTRIFTILCVLMLAIGILAFVARSRRSAQASQAQVQEIPTHVMYKHLFHHVMALKKKADEVEKQGKDSSQFRTHFIRQAQLTEDQARVLEQIASDCEQEIQVLSQRAKPIIEAYKAQYPGGRVPHGQKPAPPPPELRTMSEERNAIILRGRDRLRAEIGNDAFNRFEAFVKTRVAPNIQQMSPQ